MTVSVRLDEETRRLLNWIARTRRLSKSEVVGEDPHQLLQARMVVVLRLF